MNGRGDYSEEIIVQKKEAIKVLQKHLHNLIGMQEKSLDEKWRFYADGIPRTAPDEVAAAMLQKFNFDEERIKEKLTVKLKKVKSDMKALEEKYVMLKDKNCTFDNYFDFMDI